MVIHTHTFELLARVIETVTHTHRIEALRDKVAYKHRFQVLAGEIDTVTHTHRIAYTQVLTYEVAHTHRFELLARVMDDVTGVFPENFLHLGHDEVNCS